MVVNSVSIKLQIKEYKEYVKKKMKNNAVHYLREALNCLFYFTIWKRVETALRKENKKDVQFFPVELMESGKKANGYR